jgi:outer membrane receptor protein involved in Fe transport
VVTSNDFEEDMVITLKEDTYQLDQISITNSVKSISKVSAIDLEINPVNSSQEVLRKVPGLIIGQHAGGGKAEQIFLRGFDIDHGTDIALTVDGLPVNMVSHAHGQGYADLHFLIPETIENIDFGKGPYYADIGNFNTAGYVNFETKKKIQSSLVSFEFGKFNTFRTTGLIDLLGSDESQSAYIATEYISSDGPFESSQNFNRINIMGKYTVALNNTDNLSIMASRFQSKWDASGQIPQRLVDNGTIGRFGSVDDTEGGKTSRTNFVLEHLKSIHPKLFIKSKAYYSNYGFELFSNFTFFLEDPENGDQIKQFEDRTLYGASSTFFSSFRKGETDFELSFGTGFRYDDVNANELSHTLNRSIVLDSLSFGSVDETNANVFANLEIQKGNWLFNPGVRFDFFKFDYIDQLNIKFATLSEYEQIISPKFNVIYNPNPSWQLFIKTGKGFHSNDTRVVVDQKGKNILPAAYGVDLGALWKPAKRLVLNSALWYLFLEQEFVYVGDAAIVEPSGKTSRRGVEFGLRYQLSEFLFFDSDINYTYARATENPESEDFIPLAPDLVMSGGLVYKSKSGLNGSIRYRYIKDRPANEDNSIVAKGYFITDLNLSYDFSDLVTFGFSIENLFDQEWNEAQFATQSRLENEVTSVEELHFTPGTPFFIKGKVTFRF